MSGITAPWLLDGAMNGQAFPTYVADVLAPTLKVGDTVVLDNLLAHKISGVRERIEAVGARLLDLPADSPDFNPIEMAFAKLKALRGLPVHYPLVSADDSARPSQISHAISRRRGPQDRLAAE